MNPMRVLVVEDDQRVASFIQKGLEEEGFAVDVLHDGDEAGVRRQIELGGLDRARQVGDHQNRFAFVAPQERPQGAVVAGATTRNL